MRVPDATLDEVRHQGFSLLEGFLAPDELSAAQEALWRHFPRPEDYFEAPTTPEHAALRREPVRRRRGVPVPLVGPQPPRRPPRPRRCGRALPRDHRPPPLQGRAVGQVRRRRQLRPAAAPRLRQPQPRRAPPRAPLPADHDVHLSLRRHRGRRPHRASSPSTPARTSPSPRCTSPSGSWPTPRCAASGRRDHSSSTGPTSSTAARTSPAPAARASPSWSTSRCAARPGAGRWPGPSSRPIAGPSSSRSAPCASATCSASPRPGDPYWNDATLAGVAERYPGIDLTPYGG